jgi:hypothetical protein
MEQWWKGGKPKTENLRDKLVSVLLCPLQISLDFILDLTRVSAVQASIYRLDYATAYFILLEEIT